MSEVISVNYLEDLGIYNMAILELILWK